MEKLNNTLAEANKALAAFRQQPGPLGQNGINSIVAGVELAGLLAAQLEKTQTACDALHARVLALETAPAPAPAASA